MRFFKLSTVITLLLMVVSCQNTADNNHGLDYETIDLCFTSTIVGRNWNENDVIGLYSSCTRKEQTDVVMSENKPACFIPVTLDTSSVLKSKTESDKIVAHYGDHNYQFYAYAPYNPSIKDVSELQANIPSTINFGDELKSLFVAKKTVTNVLAPVELKFSGIACVAEIRIPDDIVSSENTKLTKMVIRATEEAPLSSPLAYNATYNLYSNELKIDQASSSKEIVVNFNNYVMPSGYTTVSLLIAPFTVPVGGLEVEFFDADGFSNIVPFLEKKAGTEFKVGTLISETLSSSSDGIVPCVSPVEWPIGYKDGVAQFTTKTQPSWPTSDDKKDHIWYSTQSEASITYVKDENNPTTVKFENNQFSQYNYSAPCVKGSWTGDYFEFVIPVKKFKANTTVKLGIPTYGRGAPLFWDVEYLDGEEWKCNRKEWTSPDGQFTKEATLMIEHGNKNGDFEGLYYEVELPFTQAIKSGKLIIRFKVAYGQYITWNNKTEKVKCKEVEKPQDIKSDDPLFAFVNKSGKYNAITVEW